MTLAPNTYEIGPPRPAPAVHVRFSYATPPTMQAIDSEGRVVFTLNLDNGVGEFAPGAQPNEAARIFLDCVRYAIQQGRLARP